MRYAQDAPLQILPKVVTEAISGYQMQDLARELAAIRTRQHSMTQLISDITSRTGVGREELQRCIDREAREVKQDSELESSMLLHFN